MKAMFIGAHLDECEYGPGGTAALLVERGIECFFYNPATFLHEPPTPEEMAMKMDQSDRGAAILGVKKEVYPNDEKATSWECTPEHELLIQKKIEEYQPDILFIQHAKDNHVEHVAVAKATYYALCQASLHCHVKEIYSFEAGPDQTLLYFHPHFTIDITSTMPKVDKCLLCYNHAFADGNGLMKEKHIGANYRGHFVGVEYGEAFRIIKFPDNGEDFILRKVLEDKFHWNGNMQYPAGAPDFLF